MNKYFFFVFALIVRGAELISADPRPLSEGVRLLSEEMRYLKGKSFGIFGVGGSFNDAINILELTVECPVSLSLLDSRKLFTTILKDWINRVNADIEAWVYYRDFPMTVNNFELRMMFKDFDTPSSQPDPKISFIFNVEDQIIYCYRNTATNCLEPFFCEKFPQETSSSLQSAKRP
jgi:hypothetical protein